MRYELERTLRRLVVGAALAAVGCAGCHSNASTRDAAIMGGSGGGGSSGSDFVPLRVGGALERICNTEPDGISLPITALSCSIVANAGHVRANLETTAGTQLLGVLFDGMDPGQKSTAADDATDVFLRDACPARAKDSPEPCAVELVELVRGDPIVTGGEVEPGSSLMLRVSCPESLTNDVGDWVTTTRQSPQRFEISVANCAAY